MWGLVGTDSGRERTGKERVYNGLRARTVAANEVIPNGLRPNASCPIRHRDTSRLP